MALKRTQMQRKPSKLKRTPLGHASPAQKAKVEREGSRIARELGDPEDFIIDAAHIIPRTHGGCDHEDCIVPLIRARHRQYDNGRLDILPYLTLSEQAHAVSHVGILGALKRTTGENYIPEPHSPVPERSAA